MSTGTRSARKRKQPSSAPTVARKNARNTKSPISEDRQTKQNLLTWKFSDLRALAMLQGVHDDEKCRTLTPNSLVDLIIKDANEETWRHAKSKNLSALSKVLEDAEESKAMPPTPSRRRQIEENENTELDTAPEPTIIPEEKEQELSSNALAIAVIQALSNSNQRQAQTQGTPNDKKITDFCAKYNLKESFVKKISSDLYVSIQDARINSALSTSQISEKSNGVHISTNKRNKIPADYGEYSALLSIIMEARSIFQVPTRNGDVEFSTFMRDYAYKFLSPIGAFAVDETIRSQNSIWWPPSAKASLKIAFLISIWKKPEAASCHTCGALEHTQEFCSNSALIFAKPLPSGRSPNMNNSLPREYKPINERELCKHFISKRGECTRSNCVFNHKCPSCNWIKKHKNTCNRK